MFFKSFILMQMPFTNKHHKVTIKSHIETDRDVAK